MIEGFERLRLMAYRDIASVSTIEYRPHRRGSEGRDITADQAYQERSLQAADRSDTVTQFNA
jgi:hypothetical protein